MTKVGRRPAKFRQHTADGLDDIGKTMNEAYGLDKITAEEARPWTTRGGRGGLGRRGSDPSGPERPTPWAAKPGRQTLAAVGPENDRKHLYAVGLTEGDVGFGPEGMTNARTGNSSTPQARS